MVRSKVPRWADTESFLPDFRRVRTAFVLLLLAEILALAIGLIAAPDAEAFWNSLGLVSLYIVWVVLLSIAVLSTFNRWLQSASPLRAGGVVVCVVEAMVLLVGWLAWNGLGQGLLNGGTELSRTPYRCLREVAVAALLTGLWLRYRYVQYQWRRHVRAEGLARLDVLQARMRPHFLFNGLNTIASLISTDPAKAEELILDFAEMFRAVLQRNARMAKLEEELHLVRQYLNVEGQRLAERLRVVWNLNGAPMDALLPPLSLQPLVENALYHGIEPLPGGGMVEIDGRLRRGEVVLTVRSPAPRAEAESHRSGNREALANLRLRLENCFPGSGAVHTSVVDGRYQARIVFPYRTTLNEDSDRR